MEDDAALAERKSWPKTWTFLVLVTVFTLLASYVIVTQPGIPGPLKPALIMWVPGLSAVLVKLVFDRNLMGLGLDRSGGKWLLVGLLLPLAYALPVYLPVWRSGLGGFNPTRWRTGVPYLADPGHTGLALALLLTVGLLDKLARALGEEIGWRGFLVPELMKHMPLWKVGVISGLIWSAYHMPLIIFGSYHSSSHGGPPIAYQIACFTVMVTSMGVFFAWLRVASQSVWPCALLHASHNLLIQSICDRATVKGPSTPYIIGEFGFGLALSCFAVALLVLAVPAIEPGRSGDACPKIASRLFGRPAGGQHPH